MSKFNISQNTLNELLSIIPVRTGFKTDNFIYFDNSISLKKANSKKEPLNKNFIDLAKSYYNGSSDIPVIRYISHEKYDGFLSSHLLCKDFSDSKYFDKLIVNPSINEKEVSSFIKKQPLIREAKNAGYIAKKGISLPAIGTFVSGTTALISGIDAIKDIISWLQTNKSITGFFGSFKMSGIIFVLALVFFIVLISNILLKYKKNTKANIENINKTLSQLNDQEYIDFIERFSYEDYCISDCNTLDSVSPIYVCTFATDVYNYRQKHILKSYLSKISDKQLWFIFIEYSKENLDFILEKSENQEIHFYYMQPLTQKQKIKIAIPIYSEAVNYSPSNDSGIKRSGVDYICRFKFNMLKQSLDTKELIKKIDEFQKGYSVRYNPADIELVIRLVASLSCQFNINFNSERWEYLFVSHQGDDGLSELDESVTERLNTLNNSDIKRIIPDILNKFGDYFEDIEIAFSDSPKTSEFRQWCIIKALKKSRAVKNDERFFAITDALMNEFFSDSSASETLSDLQDPVWINLLISTLQVFYKANIFWFLPVIIDKLILFYSKSNEYNIKIFSNPTVLEIARFNLLFNINADSNYDNTDNIDLINNHYQVVINAVNEINPKILSDSALGAPDSFGLLKLSSGDRNKYYRALCCLNEDAVCEYYEYMFDIFRASLSGRTAFRKIYYRNFNNDSLCEKYFRKGDITSLNSEYYIRCILLRFLKLLNNLCSDFLADISYEINVIKQLLIENDNDAILRQIFTSCLKFDIWGMVTLNFIACMMTRMIDSNNSSKDVYLNLGNYLIGLVFLIYHEISLGSFLNDDYIYLVKLITSYSEPGEAIIGYASYCHVIVSPPTSKTVICQYLNQHKDIYIDNFKKTAENIELENIERFVVEIYCTNENIGIMEEDKKFIYSKLRQLVYEKYFSSPKTPVLLELLSLLIDNCSTELFLQDDAENNINKILNELSNDTVYIIFRKYINEYREKYLELCPLAAHKILQSIMIGRILLIIEYLVNTNYKNSDEYIETVKLFYMFLSDLDLDYDMDILDRIYLFLSQFYHEKKDAPAMYEWVDVENIEEKILLVQGKKDEILKIMAKEYIAQRTWHRYAIIQYMRYLMTNSILNPSAPTNDYSELSDSERQEYIIKNFAQLSPIVNADGKVYFNSAYIDMLSAFINNTDDMQNRIGIGETECLRKFTNEIKVVVENYQYISELCKKDLINMIDDYILCIEKNE